jgi:hypothetical protein
MKIVGINKSLFWIILLIFFYSCKDSNHQRMCRDIRKGIFGFYGDRSGRRYTIIRTDSTQTEIDEDKGTIYEFAVNWTSDCEYEMRFLRVLKVGKDSSHIRTKFHDVSVKILSIGPDYYVFRAKADGLNIDLTDTMGINKVY